MNTEINGIQIGYEVFGQDGIPMVLIHGFGLDRSIWKTMVEGYFGDQHVIMLDLRGHGESDAPAGPYSMCQFAEDVVGLLDHLGITKAIVCGHSLGGYVALAFTEAYPDRLAGLGLITSRAVNDTEEGRAGRYALVEKVLERGSVVLAESLTPRLTKDKAIRKQSYEIIANTHPKGIIGSAIGMAERPDRTNQLSEINVPALVVAGEEDQIIDLQESIHMADCLPKGELLVIPNVGHMPMLEAPDVLGEGLLTLVEWVSDSR